MKAWIRNLTKDTELELELPMPEEKLDEVLHPNDEYLIIDCEILDVEEYDSIFSLNELLVFCQENSITETKLEVFSKVFSYHELMDNIENDNGIIIDFDAETSDWHGGRGGDITSEEEKGMCLFDSGYYNPFDFEMTEDIYDWIDWASVWTNATCEGWVEVRVNHSGYLVHR